MSMFKLPKCKCDFVYVVFKRGMVSFLYHQQYQDLVKKGHVFMSMLL